MFKLNLVHEANNTQRLEVGFIEGMTATNAEYVPYVSAKLSEMAVSEPMRGKLLKINGAASLPIATVISHKVSHLYGAIASYDPKMKGYIVCVSHDPEYKLGMVLSDEPIIV